MSLISSKIVKLAFWVFLPTFFISGTELDLNAPSTVWENDYTLQLSGNLNNKLNGKVEFETSVVTTSKGISYSTIKLRLHNKEALVSHSVEFLISRKTNDLLSKGTYEVANNQDGFLNYFDGVFGYANINALGELPLFAKSGEIQISYIDTSKVEGIVSVQMNNAKGKSIQIKGNFIARR